MTLDEIRQYWEQNILKRGGGHEVTVQDERIMAEMKRVGFQPFRPGAPIT